MFHWSIIYLDLLLTFHETVAIKTISKYEIGFDKNLTLSTSFMLKHRKSKIITRKVIYVLKIIFNPCIFCQ